MTEVIIRNKNLLNKLNGFVDEFFSIDGYNDEYYYIHDGEYKWVAEDIGKAHAWCQRKCRRFMKKQIDVVIVANTSTTEREMQPYMDLARQFGYMVQSVIVETRHEGKSTHGVPEATLDKMCARFNVKL